MDENRSQSHQFDQEYRSSDNYRGFLKTVGEGAKNRWLQ